MKKGRNDRRMRALIRLEAQLESGIRVGKRRTKDTSLTEKDKKRITKEIGILEGKLKGITQ